MTGMFLLEFKPTEFEVESSLRHMSQKNGLLCVQKCLKKFIYLAVKFPHFLAKLSPYVYVMLFWTKRRLRWSKIETFYLFFRDSATQMGSMLRRKRMIVFDAAWFSIMYCLRLRSKRFFVKKVRTRAKRRNEEGRGGGDTRRPSNNSIGNACYAGYIIITERIWHPMQFQDA